MLFPRSSDEDHWERAPTERTYQEQPKGLRQSNGKRFLYETSNNGLALHYAVTDYAVCPHTWESWDFWSFSIIVGSKEMERSRRQKQSRNKLQNNRNIDQNPIQILQSIKIRRTSQRPKSSWHWPNALECVISHYFGKKKLGVKEVQSEQYSWPFSQYKRNFNQESVTKQKCLQAIKQHHLNQNKQMQNPQTK